MPRPTNEELNSLKQELERLITSSGELISGLQKEYTEFRSANKDISTHLNTAEQIPKVLEASQETIRSVGSQINTMKESAEDNYKEIKQKLEEKYSKEFNLDDDKIIISYFKPEDTWYIEQVKFGGNKILKSIKASEIENI